MGLSAKIWGVAVCDNEAYFRVRVAEILQEFVKASGLKVKLPLEEVQVIEGYRGPGYAKTYPRLLDLIRRLAGEEGLILDPVYTGKAFLAMADMLADGSIPPDEEVLFVHTGGIFSLFAYREELVPEWPER